jgi:hypothetical protein
MIAVLLGMGCSALPRPASMTSAFARCPVTLPVADGHVPEAAARPIGTGFSGPPGTTFRLSMYGNDALWVTLTRDGIVRATARDGRLAEKIGWVRLIDGDLTISGRRLDRAAPPVQASVPPGYGSRGFQASGVIFPSEGCWEITGRIDNRDLRFVLDVQRNES